MVGHLPTFASSNFEGCELVEPHFLFAIFFQQVHMLPFLCHWRPIDSFKDTKRAKRQDGLHDL